MHDKYPDYKYLIDTMEMGLISQDSSGRIIEANHAAVKLMGFTKKQLLYSVPGLKMVDQDGSSLPWSKQPAKLTFKTGKKRHNHIVGFINNRTKEYRWFKINTIPIFGKNKKPVVVTSLICDITDQKNNEDILSRYKVAFDHSSDGVIMTNSEGLHFYQNKAFTRLFGKATSDLHEKIFVDKKDLKALLAKTAKGRNWKEEAECYGKDGKIHIVKLEVNCMKDRNGKPIGYFGLYTDITKQKKIQEELKESHEKYQALVESQTDFVSRYLPDTTLTYVNDAYCKFFGKKRDELIGNSYLFMIAPEFSDYVQKETKRLAKSGGSVTGEYLNYRYDGRPCWIQWAVQCIRDDKGHVTELQAVGRDLTERKQYEEKLRESEEKFRHLAEQSPSAIYILKKNEIIYVNKACAKFFNANPEEIIGKSIELEKFVSKDYIELVRKNHLAHLEGKDVSPFECIILNKEGKENPVIVSTKILNYQSGPAILGMITDITQQKRLEAAILESERKFRSMIENSTEAISLLNSRGEIIYDSPSVKTITGFLPEDRNGQTAFDNIHPDDREKIKRFIGQVMKTEGGMVNATFRSVKKDGTVWWTEGTAVNRLHDPDISAIIVNYRDITARKEAEDRLRLTQYGIEHGNIAIFQLDDNGRIYYANEPACKSLGYTKEEICNLSITDINPLSNWKNFKENRKKIFEKKHVIFETVHKRKNGTVFPVEVIANVIEYEGKNLAITFAKDITERKRAEKALQAQFLEYQKLNKQYEEKNAELRQLLDNVQKINQELAVAKQKAEESDRLKTAFLANMSHEIRTPMNGILGFTELLKTPDISGTDQSKYLDIIQLSGERMLNIINDLVDISKIEAGQVDIIIDTVSVNKIFDSLFEFFLPEAEKRNLLLSVFKEVRDEQCVVQVDEVKLMQILSNLIKNALKYTSKGEIQLGYRIVKNEIIFHVKDTGTGIKKEYQEKIFERFVQGEPVPGTTVEGSGLGLSISRAYIELMKGRIWLESEPGKGSVFYISLPFTSKAQLQKKKMSPDKPDSIPGSHLTILVAEDDDTSFYYLEEILKKQCFKLVRAANGKEAVDIISSNPEIIMVLMDIKMPVMNGYEATKLIKSVRPEIPVIIQTAYALSSDSKQAMDAGCDDYIVKPLHRELLLQLIKKHLKAGTANR